MITVQDPVYFDKFNITSFHHLKNGLKLNDEDDKKTVRKANQETKDVMKELSESQILKGKGAGLLRDSKEVKNLYDIYIGGFDNF